MDTPTSPPANPPPPEELWALLQRLTHVSRLATMGEMAAGIAHELNQPLTAIASYAQACDWLLARGSTDTAEIRDALQQITAQGLRAGEIIRRLRNLVRTPDTLRAETDVNELIEELKGLALTDARAHNVR
jgi:two-component system sensor kinase FixL